MPFVEFDSVKPFIQKGLHLTLMSLTQFNAYEEAAAFIIRDTAGIVIPDDIDDSPDWVNAPAAGIIQKLASSQMATKSEEFIDEVNERYEAAMKLLNEKRVQGSPTELVYALQGTITTVNE